MKWFCPTGCTSSPTSNNTGSPVCITVCVSLQETKTVYSQFCKMIPFCWPLLLLCLSANAGTTIYSKIFCCGWSVPQWSLHHLRWIFKSGQNSFSYCFWKYPVAVSIMQMAVSCVFFSFVTENTAVYRESGESVTLECSTAGCLSSNEEYVGMYLYKAFKKMDEVLYYHSMPGSSDKINPRKRYKNRVQTNGSLKNHTIVISNLTVDDAGLYSCVYLKLPSDRVKCNVCTLVVRGVFFLLLFKNCTWDSSLKVVS